MSNIVERQRMYNVFISAHEQLIAKVFTENEPKLYFYISTLILHVCLRFAPLRQLFCYCSANCFIYLFTFNVSMNNAAHICKLIHAK